MTDFSQNFSVQTRYEMALLERLQQFEVPPEVLREMLNLDLEQEVLDVEPQEFDTDLIHRIAEYLINDEELGETFDSSEADEVIRIGMFIYSWETLGHQD